MEFHLVIVLEESPGVDAMRKMAIHSAVEKYSGCHVSYGVDPSAPLTGVVERAMKIIDDKVRSSCISTIVKSGKKTVDLSKSAVDNGLTDKQFLDIHLVMH
jgi:hypothetical protein